MVKNTIMVTIPFSFKGKEYSPSAIIDLDSYAQTHDNFNSIFHQVANENKIDPYSYEYEVLESSPLQFSEASGRAVDYLVNNSFDLTAFKEYLANREVDDVLLEIAKEEFNIKNLDNDLALKNALLKAYKAGKSSVNVL